MGNTAPKQWFVGKERRRPNDAYDSEAIVEIFPQVRDKIAKIQTGVETIIQTDIPIRGEYVYDLFSITFAYKCGFSAHESTYRETETYIWLNANYFEIHRHTQGEFFSLRFKPTEHHWDTVRYIENISSIKISIRGLFHPKPAETEANEDRKQK